MGKAYKSWTISDELWEAVPKEYGSGSTIHQRFQEWQKAGFFERIWIKGLLQYDELEGIGWK